MGSKKTKKLLFRVTKKDLDIQTFRAGGPGGQRQNKRSTGVRVIHRESGAVGESREERSQLQNKRRAFERMAETEKFKTWARVKAAQVQGQAAAIEAEVDRQMRPANLRTETQVNGRWQTIP